MSKTAISLPLGWHVDPDSGVWMRDTIHRMGRRCRNWDYCGIGAYDVTLVLNNRKRPLFGQIAKNSPEMVLSDLGRAIEEHFYKISKFTPEIEVLGVQIMPEHLHGVLRVKRAMSKPLGEHLRGFKMGATKIAREAGVLSSIHAGDARGFGLFADGFVDTILFDDIAIQKALNYIQDNPRRLFEKRAHPELFRVLRDFEWRLPNEGPVLHFAAIGNLSLLKTPQILQVQCSRHYFSYKRQSDGTLDKDAPPAYMTVEFKEKLETLLAAASHGAVLISPCISQGEKEIARQAFKAGFRVITLSNKGFSPLYKPGGKLFDQCVAGNLLMLAPAAWPYLPGEKKITRMDACVLNRIAQLLAGDGAVEIDYKGAQMQGVDEKMWQATGAVL